MRVILDFFSNPIVLFSFLTVISLTVVTVVHFKINVANMAKGAAEKALSHRLKSDNKKTKRREQLGKIGKKEPKYVRKYRMAVSSIKIALGISFLSIENFTTIFLLFGLLVWGLAGFLLDNIFLGFLVAVPSIFGMLAFLLVITKRRIRANDNAVMEALDAICPSVNIGVDNAIKANMTSFDRRVKHHLEWYIWAREFRGYDFDEAMDELASRLGPRFDDFAHKAKIFEEHYRDGMEDIFKDIIETNNDVRSDNAELDEIFAESNNNLMLVSALLVGFMGYMYLNPMTSSFMIDTFLGTLVAAVEISLLILVYAVSQLLQVDIPDVEDD